jgi:hypothetical protein
MAKLDGNGVGQPNGSKIKESQPEWSLEKAYEDYMEDNGDDSYSSSGSSAVSSPIRVPYMARGTDGDSEVTRKYTDMWQAFKQKIGLCCAPSISRSYFEALFYSPSSNQQKRISASPKNYICTSKT